jgi:hypothetical protein
MKQRRWKKPWSCTWRHVAVVSKLILPFKVLLQRLDLQILLHFGPAVRNELRLSGGFFSVVNAHWIHIGMSELCYSRHLHDIYSFPSTQDSTVYDWNSMLLIPMRVLIQLACTHLVTTQPVRSRCHSSHLHRYQLHLYTLEAIIAVITTFNAFPSLRFPPFCHQIRFAWWCGRQHGM